MLADDLEELKEVLFGQIARFCNTGLVDRLLNTYSTESQLSSTMNQLEVRIPSDIGAIREAWKQDQTRPIEDGIILTDGSVITASIKVRECPAKNWQAGNLSELKPIIRLLDRNSEQWAYLAEYSYSFYPNTESQEAEELKYFRYDFHPEMLGDGDLGGHPYFHLHRDFDENDNEVGEEQRFTTGLVHLSDVMSICERKLFPEERQERLEENFRDGEFDLLALDLAPSGFDSLMASLYPKRASWSRFKHKNAFESFVKKKAWKLPNLENYLNSPKARRR